MADLSTGADVGYFIGQMVKGALRAFNKGQEFNSDLETYRYTLNSLAPLVNKMMVYNQQLDRPSREIERLQSLIREGEKLVRGWSRMIWLKRLFSFPYYQGGHLSDEVQALNTRMIKIVLHVGQLLEILNENFGQDHETPVRDLCEAPEEPERVRMDEHLSQLKRELLRDGVSVLVLTGLARSGKTTLARKICYDPQVKGKFGTNIFFVTFSQTPNLKNIVQTLFVNCGRRMPQFQNDEEAINRLQFLLRRVGGMPILMVLDDVWDNSEDLVEKFTIQIPDYKILLTSRFAFGRLGNSINLEPLDHHDAVSLFHHFAQLNSSSSNMPDDDLVNEIVKSCKGSLMALEVIGGSVRHKPLEVWQNIKSQLQNGSILESADLLCRLQQNLDTFDDKFSFSEKECFMDLGLFPAEQRIPVSTLIDMWTELHNLDEDGRDARRIVDDFATRNLIKLIVTRKVAVDADMLYNNHFIVFHGLLRELAVHQSKQEPIRQRKKLIIELNGNERPKWWVGQNQQDIFGSILSLISKRLMEQKRLSVAAQILSISTDEYFASDWCDMQPDEVEVLILNLRSRYYSLPQFTDKMSKLKVLLVTNYGSHHSKINKFELLGSLPHLKRIRLENVSVPLLCMLKNLRKLSLHMCNTSPAFEYSSIHISEAMPNLVEISIDYCKDLLKLPDGLCDITPLKKLGITNCHKLRELPQGIAKLKNLELLRLSSCSALEEMPESMGGLYKLRHLDISDCLCLAKLPENIGALNNLEKLDMKGCSALSELPLSVWELEHLKHVICDQDIAALWEHVYSIPNLKIEIPIDIDLNWIHGVRY